MLQKTSSFEESILVQLLLVFVLSATLAVKAQTDQGYTPNTNFNNSPLLGVWLNESVYVHGKDPGRNLWQRIELKSDGEMIHDYYYTNPISNQSIPFERLFSRWSTGHYIDPDSTLGKYAVLRINPYESRSLKQGTKEYRRFLNNFLPVYRRFSLNNPESHLELSEPFILVLPLAQKRKSFPSDAKFLKYKRLKNFDSAITKIGWGQIKMNH